eukprot:TRINITY_DN45873_c0_g1_i1.p1 TRINITY_DN45873_c0_g1~~TRINITY_DN45873_c0_g1_i1.p1  ORF type:complete len:104 (+),score=8.83 TRINITY_DN45873_c0_g1_i1:86-397(+)
MRFYQEPLLLMQALSFAMFGLSTGWFLKELSNITREVAMGLCTLVTVPLNHFIFEVPVTLSQVVGLLIVVFGVALYGRYPMQEKQIKCDEPSPKAVDLDERDQ